MQRSMLAHAARSFSIACAIACTAISAARADLPSNWIAVSYAAGESASESDPRWRTAENTRSSAQVALAMFEAANAVDRRYRSYLDVPAAAPGASAAAAVSSAAHGVLVKLFPDQSRRFDDALTVALARVPDGPAKTSGVELGRTVAALAIARSKLPEGSRPTPYRPAAALGTYIDPRLPSIRPFDTSMPPYFLRSAAEIRPAGPPALTSERYARDLEEVRRLGARGSKDRPSDRGLLARPWLMIDYASLVADVATLPGRSLVQNARLYALTEMGAEDTWIAIMDAKMHYAQWRPVTAIRNADRDGNDATTHDPDWESHLPTPTHPDYPCGHCGNAAYYAAILESETGPAPAGGILLRTDDDAPGMSITLPTWQAFVDEMSMSRIYAGAHVRTSNEEAERMGREVARRVLAGFMQPLTAKR